MPARRRARAFVGLGANLGDRGVFLQKALDHLRCPDVRLRRVSSVYETAPQGPVVDQPPFFNAVVEVETALGPLELLRHCLGVEAGLGRERLVAKGPRTIDLDLLMYEDRLVHEPELILPHPLLTTRAFALIPLLELAPMSVDPRNGTLLCQHAAPLLRAQSIVRLGSLPGFPASTRLPMQHNRPAGPVITPRAA